MKKIIYFFIMLMALFSCSKNEDVPTQIILSADKTTILADGKETVTFTVKDQDGVDVTSNSEIKINGNTISGNKFSTIEQGTFTAVAVYQTIESNQLQIQSNKSEQLVLKSDKAIILANNKEIVTFTVEDLDGTDMTKSSTIKVDGIEIKGNTYFTSKVGDHEAIAYSKDKQSNALTFQASKPEAIVLKADKIEIFNTGKEQITFTVTKPDGTDITKEAKIQINEKDIEGNIFSSTKEGKFFAVAFWNKNKSNRVIIDVKAFGLEIQVSKPKFVCDGIDMTTFSCINISDENKDLTKETEFFINGKLAQENFLRATEPGEFTITAKYKTYELSAVKVVAQKDLIITPKVYLEDFTGTWCPNCPRCIKLLKAAVKTGKVVGLGIHFNDEMEAPDGQKIINLFAIEGYPTIIIDRKKETMAHGGTVEGILKHLKTDPKFGIAIESQIIGNEVVADVNIVSKENRSDLKCIVMLAENNIEAPQKGDSSINSHDHVYRECHNGEILGSDISVAVGTPLKKTFKFKLNPKYNKEELDIIVLITNKDNIEVLNAQKVKVGSKVGY